ncbi:MAG: universal stress protein [Acidobacteriota bacterium]|nr:universal stress protein [Acidobacteriota bacterium]
MDAITNIIFPSDFSSTSDAAAAGAVAFARRCGAGLTVLHTSLLYEDDPHGRAFKNGSTQTGLQEGLDVEVTHAMDDQLANLETNDIDIKRVQIRGITAGRSILEYARDVKPGLIVMGTHGRRGFRRWLMGSVAEEVVRFAPCPVLTIKENWTGSITDIQKILVPLDFSLASTPALKHAASLADLFGASLEVLHVIQPPQYPEVYAWTTSEGFYEDARTRSGELIGRLLAETAPEVPAVVHTVTGYPTHEILQVAHKLEVDLILMAHMGLTRMAGRPLGSVTEHVVRAASCPVLTAELGEA